MRLRSGSAGLPARWTPPSRAGFRIWQRSFRALLTAHGPLRADDGVSGSGRMVRPHGGVRVLPGGRGRVTAGAGGAPPPGRSGDASARAAALRGAGKAPEEADATVGILRALTGIPIALLPERTARKASADSGLPPWQTDRDGAAQRGGRGAKPDLKAGDDLRRVAFGDTAAVGTCAPSCVQRIRNDLWRRLL